MVVATTSTPAPIAIQLKPTYFWQRRRFWIWSVVLFVIVVIGCVAALPTTRALVQFHRVAAGMTEQEVVELLGPPTARFDYVLANPLFRGKKARSWLVGELQFTVGFQDDKVNTKQIHTDLLIMHRFFPSLFNRNLL